MLLALCSQAAVVYCSQLYAGCEACLAGGHRQCLFAEEYAGLSGGTCCEAGSTSAYCRYAQPRNRFCASTAKVENSRTIRNAALQQWTCPASQAHCPADMDEIKIDINTAEDYAREQTWEFKVPRASFSTFHCKYQISVTQKLLDAQIGYHGKAG